jgi:hypothetical protein
MGIAALISHRSLRMTLIYARSLPRTVADERLLVSENVVAINATTRAADRRRRDRKGQTAPPDEPAHAWQRLVLPGDRDGLPFRIGPRVVLLFRQRGRVQTNARTPANAAVKGQVGRKKIFDDLLLRLRRRGIVKGRGVLLVDCLLLMSRFTGQGTSSSPAVGGSGIVTRNIP